MTVNNSPSQGLVRPKDGRMIAGVCAGMARRFGMSATTMRLLWALSILIPGPQVLAYIAMWILVPEED